MSSSSTPQQAVTKPIAQVYNPAASGNTPLLSLINALSSAKPGSSLQPTPIGQGTNDAHFTAQLCSALNLRPDSLLSNFQRSKSQTSLPLPSTQQQGRAKPSQIAAAQGPKQLGLVRAKSEAEAEPDHSSGVACNSREHADGLRAPEMEGTEADAGAQETSSNDNHTTSDLRLESLKGEPLSEEAKKKRRQEINRESARRVRKRKSLEHQHLQQQVASLQTAAASAAADQAVIVRYASELTRERDALLQRTAELEAKWITAECRNVVLRQRLAELLGVGLNDVSPENGQLGQQPGAAGPPPKPVS